MKTWSTGAPNPRGDLYADEAPVPRLTISEQFRAMKRAYRELPREHVNEVLEAMGLRL